VKRRLEGRGAVSSRRTTRISNHFTRRIAVWRALVGDTAAAVLRWPRATSAAAPSPPSTRDGRRS